MYVPQIYRAIIDDVIGNVQPDFEEYGMDEDLLAILQSKWEAKLLETRVADFARAPADADNAHPARLPPPPQPQPGPSAPYGYAMPVQNGAAGGHGAYGYAYDEPRVKAEPEDVLRLRGGSSRDKTMPPSPLQSVASLASTGSAPPKPEPNAAGLLPGDDIIDSDLDDSDDELADDDDADGDGDGEVDIVFCVYDKVQRVKNKWKTVFKDGMIHVNGRDYLFAKCTGEFEW
ncbi:transcription factor IIA subunit alpha [Cryptotrichosporon argae]